MAFGIELTGNLSYGIGAVAMVLGTLVAAYGLAGSRGGLGVRERVVTGKANAVVYALLLWVCGVAALAYIAMGLGVEVSVATSVETLRYVDWVLTTPALVAVIGIVAGVDRSDLALALGVDVVVIVVGYLASLATGALKWGGFLLAAAAFAVLLYYLFVSFGQAAAQRSFAHQALFEKIRNLTAVLWVVYPLVWIAGPPGLGLMDVAATAAVVTYLDVTAKTGYTVLFASSQGMFDSLLGRTAEEDSAPKTAVEGD